MEIRLHQNSELLAHGHCICMAMSLDSMNEDKLVNWQTWREEKIEAVKDMW
jgi:hypothetical protein